MQKCSPTTRCADVEVIASCSLKPDAGIAFQVRRHFTLLWRGRVGSRPWRVCDSALRIPESGRLQCRVGSNIIIDDAFWRFCSALCYVYPLALKHLLLASYYRSGFCTVQVECNPSCQEILKCRMQDNLLPRGPIISDIQKFTLDAQLIQNTTGLVGGFPCQVASAKLA